MSNAPDTTKTAACRICGSASAQIFTRTVLSRYDVRYYQCGQCGFIQTEEPYWLDEAYRDPINAEDTGLVQRNLLCAKRTITILSVLFGTRGSFLDYGGGYGLFVRLMRDYGFDFYWDDPNTQNLFARGFEYASGHIDAVTSFECFEHFVDPRKEIEKMLAISDTIIFSTETFASGTPDPDVWGYYYFSHGQHVSLYSLASLRQLAKQYSLNFYTNGKSYHILTPRRMSDLTFNVLTKLSVLGLPLILTQFRPSRTKTDSAEAMMRRQA